MDQYIIAREAAERYRKLMLDVQSLLTKGSERDIFTIYLLTSYIYYVRNNNVISDYDFDMICQWLLVNWSNDPNTYHKELYDKEILRAGSGYHITTYNVPKMISLIGDQLILLR